MSKKKDGDIKKRIKNTEIFKEKLRKYIRSTFSSGSNLLMSTLINLIESKKKRCKLLLEIEKNKNILKI